jgi:hypothetical protein
MVFGATGGRPQTKKPITIQERLGDDRLNETGHPHGRGNPCRLPALRFRLPRWPVVGTLPDKDAPAVFSESGRGFSVVVVFDELFHLPLEASAFCQRP